MAIGMMLSGILAGFAGVVWSIAAGHSIFLILLFYPAAGMMGALLFLAVALLRKGERTVSQGFSEAAKTH